jgi:LAO/AO transport system ATPase
VDQLGHGDRHALARLLTLVSRGEEIDAIRSAIGSRPSAAGKEETHDGRKPIAAGRTIAFTGSAGVGKSSLIGKLIELIRSRSESVAVLACDPQSPLTGGALLGDRLRMPSRPDDRGLFIRSLATAGGRGAIAEHIDLMIDLLRAFGYNWVLLETVGAGQGDTAVHNVADVVVLLLQPEAGDDIQWEKAGLLEIADIVVIHKADLPGAERVEIQVRSMLNLSDGRDVPILRVSAARSTGLDELYSLLVRQPSRERPARTADLLLRLTLEELQKRFQISPMRLAEVQERWAQGQISDADAAQLVLHLLAESDPALEAQVNLS